MLAGSGNAAVAVLEGLPPESPSASATEMVGRSGKAGGVVARGSAGASATAFISQGKRPNCRKKGAGEVRNNMIERESHSTSLVPNSRIRPVLMKRQQDATDGARALTSPAAAAQLLRCGRIRKHGAAQCTPSDPLLSPAAPSRLVAMDQHACTRTHVHAARNNGCESLGSSR